MNLRNQVEKRAEGFRGQRLYRLPVDLRKQARGDVLTRDLYLTDIGYFPESADHMVERPEGAAGAILIYSARGSGWIRYAGRQLVVPPQRALLIPAGAAHAYGADAAVPWTIHWAHFSGRRVKDYLLRLGAAEAPRVLYVPAPELICGVFESCERFLAESGLLTASTAFAHLLSVLQARQRSTHRGGRSSEDRIEKSIAWMKGRIAESPRIEELASAAALSTPHYCALFKKQTGSSPIRFHSGLKMQRACELLDHTPLSIAEVGHEVGFEDPLYFSRQFKKIIGVSPSAYRALMRG